MATVTIRPTSTSAHTGTLTGGATAHAVLSDNSDATYATEYSGSGVANGYSGFTLPAGCIVNSVGWRIRANKNNAAHGTIESLTIGGNTYSYNVNNPWTTSFTTVTQGTVTNVSFSQAEVNAATTSYAIGAIGSGIQSNLAEMYLDISYAEPPSASVTAPTGVISTRFPTFSWLFTQGTDGVGLQTFFRVRVFSAAQYTAGGFDPASSASSYDSGIVNSSSTSHTASSALLNTTTYKAYVLVWQTTSGVAQPAAAYAAGPAFSMDIIVSATVSATWALTATADAVPQVFVVAAGAWGAMVGAAAAAPHTPVFAVAAAAWGGMTGAAVVTPGALPSTQHWTDVYVEFLVQIGTAIPFVLERLLVERNHLGGYFDGSTVTGGFLSGTPSISDYRWESAPNASRSLYANEYERTNGIVDALLFDAFPINEAAKYTILSYNGVHGVTDYSTTRWGRSNWGQGAWS